MTRTAFAASFAMLMALSACGDRAPQAPRRQESRSHGALSVRPESPFAVAGVRLGMPRGVALRMLVSGGWSVSPGAAASGSREEAPGGVVVHRAAADWRANAAASGGSPSLSATRGGDVATVSFGRHDGIPIASGVTMEGPVTSRDPGFDIPDRPGTRTAGGEEWGVEGACHAGGPCLTRRISNGRRTVTLTDGASAAR